MFYRHICKGCTCGSQCVRIFGCILGQLGGSQWNKHERTTLNWEGVQCWNLVEWCREFGATCMYSSMSVCLSVCLCMRFECRVQVSGFCFIKSAIVLLTLGCYCDVRGVIGVINNTVKYHKALKCLCYIFALKCYSLIYTHFDHLFDYLIVYICLFALVLFQIVLISHYVQLYLNILGGKHNLWYLNPYTDISSHCILFCCI